MVEADKEDESLEKYKSDLLGNFEEVVVIDDANPCNVIIR